MAATAVPQTETRNIGWIEEIQGVVVEAVFPDELPEIYNALVVERKDNPEEQEGISAGTGTHLVLEVQQHLGDDRRACGRDGHDRRA